MADVSKLNVDDVDYDIKDAKAGVVLTQAQYDALSTAEKNNGTTYFINDSSVLPSANNVSYDGTTSGLSATEVQSAIDEVNSKFGNLASSLTTTRTFTSGNITINANASMNIYASTLGITTPTGYAPMAILAYECSSDLIIFRSIVGNVTGNRSFMVCHNLDDNNAVTCTFSVTLLYINTTSLYYSMFDTYICTYNDTITVPGLTAVNITANDVGYLIPTGYAPMGVLQIYTNVNPLSINGFNVTASGTDTLLTVRNSHSTSYDITNFTFSVSVVKT